MEEDIYFDYVSDAGIPSHLPANYPRHALRHIQHLAAYIRTHAADSAARFNLQIADMYILLYLERSPGEAATVNDITDALFYTTGSMTKRIDRLESSDFIERIRQTTDRRSVLIHLTDAGRACVKKIIEYGRTNNFMTQIRTALDETEWSSFLLLLEKLENKLSDIPRNGD